jgi:hypothetical protein
METNNNLKDTSRKYLQTLGVVNTRVTHEDSLRCGFIFALWTNNHLDENTLQLDFLKSTFDKIHLNLDDLTNIDDNKEKFKKVCEMLSNEHKGLDLWFKLGLWTHIYTWLLGHDYSATDTQTARNLISENTDIRKAGSNFIGSLQDLGWSTDKIDTYNLEKLIPFLSENGLRKWVGHPDMAVMSDLRYEAKQLDIEIIGDTKEKRFSLAIKELISAIPFVGKAIAALLFGNKK